VLTLGGQYEPIVPWWRRLGRWRTSLATDNECCRNNQRLTREALEAFVVKG
jgi:hypothetical protein